MADFMNLTDSHYVQPTMVVDELSAAEFYVGVSNQGSLFAAECWRIKRIWKIGNIWHVGYPSGDQSFGYVWDDRTGYSYS